MDFLKRVTEAAQIGHHEKVRALRRLSQCYL
jgi:hypothetical protein